MMRWFQPEEYRCRCGRPECDAPRELHPELAAKLDILRDSLGHPLIITSGLRCRVRNAEVGGAADSRHLTGRAVDVACDMDDYRDELLVHLYARPIRLFPTHELAPKHVHLDIDMRGTRPRCLLGAG